MMLTLLYGTQEALIRARTERILLDRLGSKSDFERFEFDARETLIQEIGLTIATLSLGFEKRAVIVRHSFFFEKKRTKEKIEKENNYDLFCRQIATIPQGTEVIFTVETEELDTKSKLYPFFKEKAQITAIPTLDKQSWPEFIQRYFEKFLIAIDPAATNELVARSQGDVQLFFSYAEKLMIGNPKTIDRALVLSQIPRSLEENLFELTNALTKLEIAHALSVYRDLRVNNEEPVTLIALLGKQFRLMQMVQYLAQEGEDLPSTAKKLKVHEYRVKLALGQKRTFTLKRLEAIQAALFELDFKIKTGQIDRFVGFELFLLNFNQFIS